MLGEGLSRSQRLTYIIILGMLTALGPFTVDLYLPALPSIQQQFGVGTAATQMTLTGTLIGFGLGQLIVGPLSDKVGRKIPLTLAAIVHVAASIGVATAPSIEVLTLFRVLQGFGAASSAVVTMAIVRDLFGGRRLVVMLSRLALVNGLAPVIAPVVGAQLLRIMDWRGTFWVLACYGLMMSILTLLFVTETLPKERRREHGKSLYQGYVALAHDRVFIGVLVVASMNNTGLFSYLSASSFLFQDVYGFTPQQFGWMFAVNSVGILIGVQISARLMNFGMVPAPWILAGTTAAQFILGSAILIFGRLSIWGVVIPLGLFIMACGFAFPALQYLALVDHGAEAGTAASLLGAVNSAVSGALTPLIGLAGITSAAPMAGLMTAGALVGIAALWLIVRPRSASGVAE